MTSELYQKKLNDAKAREKAVGRAKECNEYFIQWIVQQGFGKNYFNTPEQDIQNQDSWKHTQKNLGAPILHPRGKPIWKNEKEIFDHFNQRWSDESQWRQRLGRCGIPYAERSDLPEHIWNQIEPQDRVGEIKIWLEGEPSHTARGTRGHVLLSLMLYKLFQMEVAEKAKIDQIEAARTKDENEPQGITHGAMQAMVSANGRQCVTGEDSGMEPAASPMLSITSKKGGKRGPGRESKWDKHPQLVRDILNYAKSHSEAETANHFNTRCEHETDGDLNRDIVKNLKAKYKESNC